VRQAASSALASSGYQGTGHIVALPPVEPAPPQPAYLDREANALGIEGMMSPFSMQVMDALLNLQSAQGTSGHLLEFGVWRGRSAAIISAHRRADDRLILCDVGQYVTEEVLARLYARPEFVLGKSCDFARILDTRPLRGTVRFIHVDSSHSYRDTLAEMALVDAMLAPEGIACLDDFTNLNYSQILPAVFKYIYTTRTDLAFFLVTNDKGYLCRRPAFERYAGFVLDHLVDEMRARGNDDVMLSRTDTDPEYRAFYLRPRGPGETGTRFGEQIYGAFYKAP
jgi:predicted O-methyltransferase YrrM